MEMDNSYLDTRYSTPKRKVLGNISNGSPVSPMANLKLLTKVATSEAIANEKNYISELQYGYDDQVTPNKMVSVIRKKFDCGYIRRNKSLSILCEKFTEIFPLDVGDSETKVISIKHMATALGVEKRRVYDIINIVESLDMAKKFAKDSYFWFGNNNIPAKMAYLDKYAFDVGLHNEVKKLVGDKKIFDDVHIDLPHFQCVALDERRIGVLCQKFVMLILAFHNVCPLTLDVAFSILVGPNEVNKTKSRRLYDIANVLVALGIITRLKTMVGCTLKKPAFCYSGPCFNSECDSVQCSTKKHNKDHAVFTAAPSNAKTNESIEIISLSDESRSSEDVSLPHVVKEPVAKKRFIETIESISLSDESRSSEDVSLVHVSKEPVAKKRLIFKQDMNITFTPVTNVIHKQFDLKSCKPLGSVVLQRSSLKLEPGSTYKAVRVGTAMQLVKLS